MMPGVGYHCLTSCSVASLERDVEQSLVEPDRRHADPQRCSRGYRCSLHRLQQLDRVIGKPTASSNKHARHTQGPDGLELAVPVGVFLVCWKMCNFEGGEGDKVSDHVGERVNGVGYESRGVGGDAENAFPDAQHNVLPESKVRHVERLSVVGLVVRLALLALGVLTSNILNLPHVMTQDSARVKPSLPSCLLRPRSPSPCTCGIALAAYQLQLSAPGMKAKLMRQSIGPDPLGVHNCSQLWRYAHAPRHACPATYEFPSEVHRFGLHGSAGWP
mmetsp:Transcript_28781/g.92872  ORF Transcript_28781/g.92872 Transcript_28781/m.92872 type:complete len:274 (-) Transcript_28781:2-823(-)